MLRIAVCDDNNSIRARLIGMLNHTLEQYNIKGEVVFEAGDPEVFYDFIVTNPVDVIFLDIEFKLMQSGLDLAKRIREINKTVNIIFITAHIEYVFIAFKFKTFDYLVKPISQEKLEECILRLVQYTATDSMDSVKIKSGSTTYVIMKNDIIFVEKSRSKSHVYTANEIIETTMTLEDFQAILPSNFFRSHKSYIVNTNKITRVEFLTNEIFFVCSYKCYIGRKYKKEFASILSQKVN